jgi:hypothetical protein
MIRALLEIGGVFGAALAGRAARKKAFQSLIQQGLLPSTASFRAGSTQALLKKIGGRTFNPAEYAAQSIGRTKALVGGGTRGVGVFAKGRLSQVARTGPLQMGAARGQAANALQQAAGHMAKSRGFSTVEKVVSGIFGVQFGFSLVSGAGNMFEKNIPAPAQEILQTQQSFLLRQAYTQRQRAIQAIHQSGMTTRSALGHEASYMHG